MKSWFPVVVACALIGMIGCGEAPTGEDAIADFNRAAAGWKSVRCESPEVVGAYTKSRHLRQYGIRATCVVAASDAEQERFYLIEYANSTGLWRLLDLTVSNRHNVELLNSRTPVKLPTADETMLDSLSRAAIILAPIATGVILFVITAWILRSRQGSTRIPPRRIKLDPSKRDPPRP